MNFTRRFRKCFFFFGGGGLSYFYIFEFSLCRVGSKQKNRLSIFGGKAATMFEKKKKKPRGKIDASFPLTFFFSS